MMILAVTMIMIAAPRLLHELALVPGAPIHKKLTEAEPVYAAEIDALESSRLGALAIASTPDAEGSLGLTYLLKAQREENPEDRAAWADMAVSHFENSLRQARFEPYIWHQLATAYLMTNPSRPVDAAKAWQASVETASYEPRLLLPRIHVGILAYSGFDETQRELMRKQFAIAYERSPLGTRQYGTKFDLLDWFVFLSPDEAAQEYLLAKL